MLEHTDLSGKRILLTGGTTGIGRATLELLASEGARILTFGRDEEALADTLTGTSGGAAVVGITADAATVEGIEHVFQAVDAKLGGIDILIACAALGADPIDQMAEGDWRYVVETNLVGYLACAKAAIERMEAQGGGHLLFVGSISTEIKAVGESVYSATKAGIQAFAETLRKEVADRNIRVSVVQPGSVDTDMQECSAEEKRAARSRHEMLQAEEVAEAIRFILTRSPACDIVNLRIEPRLQKTS
ncbi:NADP-dependent 3-hydroxy acid dehydrogenase YdfG [Sphingomonas zeicaulis]|uniref:SDR family oxidoreductase n=1 Tax=Sphingomonas zeicaulis TaxID=1632740 RepID=UPI003D2050DB